MSDRDEFGRPLCQKATDQDALRADNERLIGALHSIWAKLDADSVAWEHTQDEDDDDQCAEDCRACEYNALRDMARDALGDALAAAVRGEDQPAATPAHHPLCYADVCHSDCPAAQPCATCHGTKTVRVIHSAHDEEFIPCPQCAAAQPAEAVVRTPQDYAIEHGLYLATAVDGYMAARNAHDKLLFHDETDPARLGNSAEALSDHWNGLRDAVYEFRKRAARAKDL